MWQLSTRCVRRPNAKRKDSKWTIQSAINKVREGLLGNACQTLSSSGVAPNTPENLLQQKHPKGPIPTPYNFILPSSTSLLPPEFDIMSVLLSFPKGTACGPSGLRIQHLIDSAEVHLPNSISSSLKVVINLLATGKAPVPVSKYLAGGSLTAIVKNKEGHPLDIRLIAVGESLRRLTGKCLCVISKQNSLPLFSLVWLVQQEVRRSSTV